MKKKLIGKWKKGNIILEIFDKNGVPYVRTTEVFDENLSEVSDLEEFENFEKGETTLLDILEYYDMSGAEKID